MNVFDKLQKPVVPDPIATLHELLDINTDMIQRRCDTSSRAWQELITERSEAIEQGLLIAQQFEPFALANEPKMLVEPIADAAVHNSDQFEALVAQLHTRFDESKQKLASQLELAEEEKKATLEQLVQAEDEHKVSLGIREKAQAQADELYAELAEKLANIAMADEEARLAAEKAAAEEERERRAQLEQEKEEKRAREMEERRVKEAEEREKMAAERQKANEERQRAAEERMKKLEAARQKAEEERQEREAQRQALEEQRQEKLEQARREKELERQQRERELEQKRLAMLAEGTKPSVSATLPQEFTSAQFVSDKQEDEPPESEPQTQQPIYEIDDNQEAEKSEEAHISDKEQEIQEPVACNVESIEEHKDPSPESSQSEQDDKSTEENANQQPVEETQSVSAVQQEIQHADEQENEQNPAEIDPEEQARLEQLRRIEERLARRARQKGAQ